jgi:hypothetical protein
MNSLEAEKVRQEERKRCAAIARSMPAVCGLLTDPEAAMVRYACERIVNEIEEGEPIVGWGHAGIGE